MNTFRIWLFGVSAGLVLVSSSYLLALDGEPGGYNAPCVDTNLNTCGGKICGGRLSSCTTSEPGHTGVCWCPTPAP